ncbi:MAG: MFS transporter, partial [Candidatus Hydrogenedentota bacterium]
IRYHPGCTAAFVGQALAGMILVIFVATLLAGFILDRFQEAGHAWSGFAALFTVAMVSRLWSARLLSLHYDAPYRPSVEAGFSFWNFLRRTPQSNFMKFTFYAALMNGAIMISGPFFAAYMLRDLGFSYTEFTINSAVLLLASTLSIRWWGNMGDRHGNRAVLVATGFLLPVMPLLWAFTTSFYGTLAIQVLAGLSWSGFGIATQNYIFDAVTSEKRARVIGYYSVVNGIFAVIGGTVVGGYLAEHLPSSYSFWGWDLVFISSLPVVFIVSSVLRLVVAIVMLPLFKEVRPAEMISPGRLILRLSSGEPISEALWNAIERVAALKKKPPR